MRVHVTDLDQLLWFRRIEAMTTEELVSRLRREEPPNRAMAMGTAWHGFLEDHQPDPDEIGVEAVRRDGFTFLVECDAEITLPQIREIRAEKTYAIDGLPVTLTGGCDGITGNVVTDHKLTARPDPEKYLDSYQWRAYLDIYNADVFEYILYHALDRGEEKGNQVIIRDVSTFRFYRYPGIQSDLLAGIREFVEFARVHLPERLQKVAA